MADGLFVGVLVFSTITDGCVGALALLGPSLGKRRGKAPAPITLRRVIASFLAVAVSYAAKLPLWTVFGVNAFGAMHLAFLDGAVVVPLLGAAAIVAAFRRGRLRGTRPGAAVIALALLACCGAPLAAYATFVEPFRLTLEQADVPVSATRHGRGEIRVGILADLQTAEVTRYEHRAVDELVAASPDVILLPGDLFQGSAREFDSQRGELCELLGRLRATHGVYLSLGNMDRPDRVRSLIEDTSIRLLDGECVTLSVGDRKLTIAGISLWDAEAGRRLIDRLEKSEPDDIRILMAHDPGALDVLRPNTRIDLLVSGHTHGGQIQLPWFGPLLTLSSAPRQVCGGGLHNVGGRRVYVSRGVGCERGQAPRIRFLCPPEITLLTLGSHSLKG